MKDEFKEMLKLFGVAPDLLNMDNIISKGEKQQQQRCFTLEITRTVENIKSQRILIESRKCELACQAGVSSSSVSSRISSKVARWSIQG